MPHKDPSSLSFQSAPTRRLVLASCWALILLAVPLWWHTTSIERLALPSTRVAQALAAPPLRFPVDVHISGATSQDISELQENLKSCEAVDLEFHAGEGQDQFGEYSVSIDPNVPPSVHGRHLSLPDGAYHHTTPRTETRNLNTPSVFFFCSEQPSIDPQISACSAR